MLTALIGTLHGIIDTSTFGDAVHVKNVDLPRKVCLNVLFHAAVADDAAKDIWEGCAGEHPGSAHN